jgi:serine/threonine-protein kinase
LAEAHHVGLIHRDVKPANVFLCRRGLEHDAVKVLDFGLVREVSSTDVTQSALGALQGTPLYMSPEQIREPQRVDARSDLYSLGAVGYFLLTGTPPFAGASVVEVCGHHLHSKPVRPAERLGRAVPEALEDIVLSLLEKQPAARPESAQALLRSLRACPGIDAWTDEQAFDWWQDRGGSLAGRAESPSRAPEPAARTIAIDLAARS